MQDMNGHSNKDSMSENDLRNACEKVIDAARHNDTKKTQRYLSRYSSHSSKVSQTRLL